jgi:hypothetical protein
MEMEILYKNYYNTTTSVYVSTNTDYAQYLFDREKSQQYQSSGDNSDATTTTIRVDFSAAKNVDRIALQNINLKSFKMYYNSNSANLFSLSSALTGTSEWTQNSATSLYLILAATVSVTSVWIEATATTNANQEKKIGQFWISGQWYQLERNPSAKNFKAKKERKEYKHEMSDGGTATYVVADKYAVDIRLKYWSSTGVSTLEEIHEDYDPLVFVPEPTGTAWDGQIYECNWISDFTFKEYSNNYKGNGFSGRIRLRETPK